LTDHGRCLSQEPWCCAILRAVERSSEEVSADQALALAIDADGNGGALPAIAAAVAAGGGRITWISILDAHRPVQTILLELVGANSPAALPEVLQSLPEVHSVAARHTLQHIFGQRIIIIGGG